MAERQFGPYRLVRQVAVGGMAEIHLAKTKGIAGFEKYVAIKMIHPNFAEDDQFIQMLVDEAKIAVQLSHGNIAQTFDLGRVGETYYITMEFVDGSDLYKILRRGSEQDLEMPLDVCAFIGKEVASALDYAHRKRDHTGRSLGIVHRDVSPQNVLVSYAGEVKLVDFGIAKAASKVRQTAAGVIKGKYYYMSPEQAWGDPLDSRSDIFSAGIVLYEMITGQMLYLEEDLHKLLDMARRADIAPPSTLRRGVPPQLERIIMHALQKQPDERYQTAGDFASDLERFLHAYSPVFTANKLSSHLRNVIGDPIQVPDEAPEIEVRDGPMSTHPLGDEDLIHARDEFRDENSVIFRMNELKQGARRAATSTPAKASPQATAPAPQAAVPRVTRVSEPVPTLGSVPAAVHAPVIGVPKSIPSVGVGSGSGPVGKPRQPAKPRQPLDETREMDQAPANPNQEESGLLSTAPPPRLPGVKAPTPKPAPMSAPMSAPMPSPMPSPMSAPKPAPMSQTTDKVPKIPRMPRPGSSPAASKEDARVWGDHIATDELEGIGERTLVTAAPSGFGPTGAFLLDGGDGIEATLVTKVPGFDPDTSDEALDDTSSNDDEVAAAAALGNDTQSLLDDELEADESDDHDEPSNPDDDDDDGPTLARQHVGIPARRAPAKPVAPPPALAAKIHSPAVSALRTPRPSRRTPPGGSPATQSSVLQAVLGAQSNEPMPAPSSRAHSPSTQPLPLPTAPTQTMPSQSHPQLPGLPGLPGMPTQQYQNMPLQAPPNTHPYAYQNPPEQQHNFPVGSQPNGSAYMNDASGLPLGIPTPPSGVPQAIGHSPSQSHPYPANPVYPVYPQAYPTYGEHHMTPGALYQMQPPYGAQAPQPATITGQLRLSEGDELPAQYRLDAGGKRWLVYVLAGTTAVSLAAIVTFFVIRSMREPAAPTIASIQVDSTPTGASVYLDDQKLPDKTPMRIDGVAIANKHKLRLELDHYKVFTQDIDMPLSGAEARTVALLERAKGKIRIDSQPTGAEIRLNGKPELRGLTPTTLSDIDIESTTKIELRLKDYQLYIQPLQWPKSGEIDITKKLERSK